jgi:hypothetical protein
VILLSVEHEAAERNESLERVRELEGILPSGRRSPELHGAVSSLAFKGARMAGRRCTRIEVAAVGAEPIKLAVSRLRPLDEGGTVQRPQPEGLPDEAQWREWGGATKKGKV